MNKLILLVPFLLAGCFSEAEVNDVEYYLENKSERLAMIKKCENDATLIAKDANCINAMNAADKKAFDPSNTFVPVIK